MVELHLIIIPPLKHTKKSIKNTCSGEGLSKEGFRDDSHAEKLIPPKNTKPGAQSKELEKKSAAYWKAQCALQGLNQSGTVSDIQLRLREAEKNILPELNGAETEPNKELKKNNQAEETIPFPKTANGRPANLDIVVLKLGVNNRLKVSDAAEAMSLENVWIVIGRTRDAVCDQMRSIECEASTSKQTFSVDKAKSQTSAAQNSSLVGPGKKPTTPKTKTKADTKNCASAKMANSQAKLKPSLDRNTYRSSNEIRSFEPEPQGKQRAKRAGGASLNQFHQSDDDHGTTNNTESNASSDDACHLRGSDIIKCQELEEANFQPQSGRQQLYGTFNFGIIKGIIRVEKPVPAPRIRAEALRASKKGNPDELDADGTLIY